MEKVQLGKTGLTVSRIGFGGIPIQRVSEDEAVSVVKRCLELGINYFDTANAYTNSEGRIGKAIAGRREGLVIATKSASRNAEEVKNHLQQSLKQLGVEYIDLFQFHNVSTSEALDMILAPGGPLSVIQKAKKDGIVKHIGLTSHQVDTAKAAVKTDCFETIMFPFNFIACEPADELLAVAREHNTGFIAMKPLAGGMLDNVNIAFKYLLQFPDVVPIVGIERIPEIDEIVKVLEDSWQMNEAEQREMQGLRDELGKAFCRRCDYCQPCTAGITISDIMILPSLIKRLSPERLFSGRIAESAEKAALCVDCGECEERCPYHLPIRQALADNVKAWENGKKKYEALLKNVS